MHFSSDRVPEDLADLNLVNPFEYMDEAARDVFVVAEEFVSVVERSGHRLADMFRQALDASRAAYDASG